MKTQYLSIGKRDADCYDVYDRRERIAALRSDFTTDEKGVRTATPGTWQIRWEHTTGEGLERRFVKDTPRAIEDLRFGTVHEAFAFYCGQVLA